MKNSFKIIELDNQQFNASSFEHLGKSYDSVYKENRVPLLIGEVKTEPVRTVNDQDILRYKFSSSQEEFSKDTAFSVSAKANFGIARAKSKFDYTEFFSKNDYSCYLFGFMRLTHPKQFISLPESTLVKDVENFISSNQRHYPDDVERFIGDQVITSVIFASEIMVKMEIKTTSETNKQSISASIKGSYGTAQGKGKFSQVTNKFKDYKDIEITVMGDFPQQFLRGISPVEVDSLLLDFASTGRNNVRIEEYASIPLNDVPQLLKYNDIVNFSELTERSHFLDRINLLYEKLDDWESNIKYVLSNVNGNEFSDLTIRTASQDYEELKRYRQMLVSLYDNSRNYWLTYGKNGSAFKSELLNSIPSKFRAYERNKPVFSKAPVPTSAPSNPKEPHEGRNSGGGPKKI